jgi:predicted nicotinamide N-methyase
MVRVQLFIQTLNEYRSMSNRVIQVFQTEYMSNSNLEESRDICRGTFVSICAQNLFLQHVILHKSVKKFPMPTQYTAKVIKRFIHEIENIEREGNEEDGLSESLLEFYWNICSTLPTGPDSFSQRHLQSSHRIYDMNSQCQNCNSDDDSEENLIVLKVWSPFTHVGLAMWEAGYYIAEWILANADLFAGKRILELGSGVGLSGIVLARSFDSNFDTTKLPNAIYMTDYLDVVLRNCVDNMKINGLKAIEQLSHEDMDEEESDTLLNGNKNRLVHVCHLDWTKFTNEQLESMDPNIILAADVIYDISVIEGLVNLTSKCISRKGVIAYFAITKRNEKTFEYFKEQCTQKGIETIDITDPNIGQFFPYEGRENVQMFQLSLSHSVVTDS